MELLEFIIMLQKQHQERGSKISNLKMNRGYKSLGVDKYGYENYEPTSDFSFSFSLQRPMQG